MLTPRPVEPVAPAPDQTAGAPVSGTEYELTRSLSAIGCTARTPGSRASPGTAAAGTFTATPESRVWVR
ncbi:hypothetical protein [Kitasatospora albolonga]|uniref:hypothetical protein n=1 Tax=Kitasatospora albolonga TaxID=68173 RepID=UPI0031E7C65E